MKEEGFLIFVTGHPYFGRHAYNLASSIKAMDAEAEIAICYNGNAMNHLAEHQYDVFDYVIKADDKIPASHICKLYAPEYTPFKRTVLLDADMLWMQFKKPSELFSELKDVDFTAINEGNEADPHPKYFFWANVEEIKSKYQIKAPIHQWRTEVMYFNENGAKVLTRALEIVTNPDLTSIMQFAHDIPDELGINIAAAEAGILPHKYKWCPSYWTAMHGSQIPAMKVIGEDYYLMSFGGNGASGTLKGVYGSITQACAYKRGVHNVFPLFEKRSYLKMRDKI